MISVKLKRNPELHTFARAVKTKGPDRNGYILFVDSEDEVVAKVLEAEIVLIDYISKTEGLPKIEFTVKED